MAQKTTIEHFVPKFLINRGEKNNKLLILNKNEKKIIDFKDNNSYFAEKDFYESLDFPENFVENKLAKIEERYAKLTQDIIERFEDKDREKIITENEAALIETFSRIQFFRTKNYQNKGSIPKDEVIKKITEFVDEYFNFCQMGMKEKQEITNKVFSLIMQIDEKYPDDYDKAEYEKHKILNDPKYHLVGQTDYLSSMDVIKSENTFPLSVLGAFKESFNNDLMYFFVIPISPDYAIIKEVRLFPEPQYSYFIDERLKEDWKRKRNARYEAYCEIAMFNVNSIFPMNYKNFYLYDEYEKFNSEAIIGVRGSLDNNKNVTVTNKEKN